MKRIAILSLVFDNYGTRLQSYALCKVLNRICGEKATVEVVDVETPFGIPKNISKKKLLVNSFRKYGLLNGLRYIYRTLKWVYERRITKRRASAELEHKRAGLFQLLNSKIPYTKRHYSMDDVRGGALDNYDTFVVGSDQVWNGVRVPNQDVFLCNFAKSHQTCLTYAASFGTTVLPPPYQKYLQ